MIPLTNLHKNRLLEQALTGVANIQESIYKEPLYFIKLATGELLNPDTGTAFTEREINRRIGDWLASLDFVRSNLRTFRDVTVVNCPDIVDLAALRGITPQDLDVPGQAVGDLLDEFTFRMEFTPELIAERTDKTLSEIIEHCSWLHNAATAVPGVWENQLV